MSKKNLYSSKVIKDIMRANNLHFKKSLGQNFLTDANVLEKISQAAEVDKESTVIEIGPGIGTLTEVLARDAGQVLAIEIDQRFIPVLETNFYKQDHVQIIHADAMNLDLHQLIADEAKFDKVHIVANLPYYITSPLIMKFLEDRLPLTNIVVMIQKEVAERIQAKPGKKDYGALSIAAQYYAECKLVSIVSKKVFLPEPKVDSAVIKLAIRPEPAVAVPDQDFFFRVVKSAFVSRRKTIWNNFKAFDPKLGTEELTAIFAQAEIAPQRRGETISIEEYARLSRILWDKLGN